MNVDIRLADVMSISDMFDCIVCMNVLEHIRDDHDALTHMLSRLNSGGTLFLLVPAHQGLFTAFDVAAGHYRRYNKESMAALIAAIGSHDFSLRQYYFSAIGAIGYYIVYGLLRTPPKANASAEIGLFDRYVVPVQRVIEPRWMPFGISLITVIRRQPVDGR